MLPFHSVTPLSAESLRLSVCRLHLLESPPVVDNTSEVGGPPPCITFSCVNVSHGSFEHEPCAQALTLILRSQPRAPRVQPAGGGSGLSGRSYRGFSLK